MDVRNRGSTSMIQPRNPMSRYQGVTISPKMRPRIMIGAVTNNTLLAALFGPGIARVSGAQTGQQDPNSQNKARILTETDRVELSPAAKLASDQSSEGQTSRASGLGDPKQKEIQKLKQRDAEVRRHEAAHKGAAGPHAKGGPKFEFESGPNGRQYAVGGEVSIDTSEVVGNPNATIQKMQQVRRAALAPANPSAQDRAVAATATKLEQNARAELSERRREGGQEDSSSASPYDSSETNHEASRGLLMSLVA